LRLFLTDAVEAFPGENLTTNEIVEKYAGYCSTHGWNMTMRKTEEQLPDLMIGAVPRRPFKTISRRVTMSSLYLEISF
jgi:hypothetical protein